MDPNTRCVRVWDRDNSETLRDVLIALIGRCFFYSWSHNVDEIANVVTSYIHICEQTLIQTKTVMIFPNNKPWITKEIRRILIEKIITFLNGGGTSVRRENKEESFN